MEDVLILALMVIFSFGIAVMIDRIGVPRVSIYVLVGVLLSDDLLGGVLGLPKIEHGPTLTNIALGIIAFLIGIELEWNKIRSLGKTVVWGTFGQIIGAVFVVWLGLLFLSKMQWVPIDYPVIVILAGLAATTDPGGTLGIIDQYKAKGTLTTILLGIVILDDALGVVVFESLVGFIHGGHVDEQLVSVVLKLGASLAVGVASGFLLGKLSRRLTDEELRFPVFIGFILLGSALGFVFDFSPILICMVMGFITQVVSNQDPQKLVTPIKHIEEFVFILLFVFAGLSFELEVLQNGIYVLVSYIVLRAIGKYVGSWLGTSLAGCDEQTRRLVGWGLMPQAGVAIGLALSISYIDGLSQYAPIVFNTVLASTVFYEIIGPFFTKWSLVNAKEITPEAIGI